MTTDTSHPPITSATSATEPTDQQATAAQQAISVHAREQNSLHVSALADSANGKQRAEHIRGVVAATMNQISVDAAALTLESAQEWQSWALRLADGIELGAST